MPTLPTADSLGYVVPRGAPKPTPPDLTGPLKAVGQIGTQLSAVGMEEKNRENALELIQADAKHHQLLGDLQRQILMNPDYSQHEQMFKEGSSAITQQTMGMISSPHAREQWAARAAMRNESALHPIFNDARRAMRQEQTGDLNDSLNEHLSIIQNPDSTQQQIDDAYSSIDQSIRLAERTRIVSPVRSQRLRDKYFQYADEYRLRNRINRHDNFDDIMRDIWGNKAPRSDRAEGSTPAINSALNDASAQNGQDARVMQMIMNFESGGRPSSQTGSYKGLFNLSDSEFRNYGGTGDIYGVKNNIGAAIRKIANETKQFENEHGVIATPLDQYLIHNQGLGGYNAHIGDPNEIAWKNLMKTAEGRQKGPEWAKAAVIGNMTPEMKKKYGSDVDKITSGNFIEGWQDRVNRSLAGETYGGPYRHLTPQQRSRLTNIVKGAYRGYAEEDVKNSIAQILDTGQAPVDAEGRTALDRALPVLTDHQKVEEKNKWLEATLKFKAKSPLSGMSEIQARSYIDKLFPSAGEEHYDVVHRVHDFAAKEWDKIQKERDTDPAQSVERSQRVSDTMKSLAAQRGRIPADKAREMLIDARIGAQNEIEIPSYKQRMITQKEADEILQLPKNPTEDDIDAGMRDANGRAAAYGKYAKDVLRQAITMRITGKTNRQAAEDLIDDLAAKKPESKGQGWFDSVYNSLFGPSAQTAAKHADPREIEWVKQDPEQRWRIFDEKYGAGSWARQQAEEVAR